MHRGASLGSRISPNAAVPSGAVIRQSCSREARSVDVAVLGAGPAGVMAALRLARSGRSVAVLEQAPAVGGMAGSFEVAGVRVDYGSHRLHPTVQPWLRAELTRLLGSDLQEKRRRGRIALGQQWLKFPLNLPDLARHLPPSFLARVALDTATRPLRRPAEDSAGAAIAARLGPTVARNFYTPYLVKLWGAPPEELSVELADRRVSARSGTDVLKKALRARRPGGGTFLYPRHGFGQISEAIAEAATDAGAEVRLGAAVTGLRLGADRVEVASADGSVLEAATVLSSLPVSVIARLADAPADVVAAGERLRHRAMVLVYLIFDVDRLTEFDAHYFPGLETPVSRLSEPKNFRDGDDPAGVTVLCAEVPCWKGDDTWNGSAEDLAQEVLGTLASFGFQFPALAAAEVRRIPNCYPVYSGDYALLQAEVEAWADRQDRLLVFGRQGLFATDNTHHVLQTGWDAAAAIQADGRIDRAVWGPKRQDYRSHVVED